MNPEIAKQLFEHGAFCVLLDVPLGSEFGIDWKSWNTDTQFKGLKLIPPGIHYIHYSIKSGDMSPQSGFLHSFAEKEVFVRRWNKSSGTFDKVDSLTNENIKNEENLKNLDKNLAPYPYESYKQWCGLSNNIMLADLTRLLPPCGFLDSIVDYEAKVDENNRCTETDEEGLPVLTIRSQSKIGFTKVERQEWWPADCTPTERSVHAQDSTWFIQKLIQDLTLNGILAEFQFAYVTFLVGQIMSSFDQWKSLLRVFCFCRSISSHEVFYKKVVSALYFQMETIPADFMVDIVSSSNIVLHCLNEFFRNMYESDGISAELKHRTDRFRTYCQNKFNWTFYQDGEESGCEDEDEAPVIVFLG